MDLLVLGLWKKVVVDYATIDFDGFRPGKYHHILLVNNKYTSF